MGEAELRQAVHGSAIFLVGPGELQPEVVLCERSGDVTARDEDTQCGITVPGELLHARLQRAELFPCAPRQKSRD